MIRSRDEAASYKQFDDEPIPGSVLAEWLAGFVHAYTTYWSVRPFGASVLIYAWDTVMTVVMIMRREGGREGGRVG